MDEIMNFRKEKDKAEKKGNLKETALMCNVIGELLSKNGQYEDALAEHEQELFLSKAVSDKIGIAVAHRKIGECHMELGNFDEAIKHQRRHLCGAQAEQDDVEIQRAFATIGRTYLCQAEATKDVRLVKETLQKAKIAFQQCLEFCEKLKSSKISPKELAEMKARSLLNLGLVYDQKSEYKKCIELIEKAIGISEIYNLKEDVYRCQLSLAGIYQRQATDLTFSQAIRFFDAAILYAKSTHKKTDQTYILQQKALIFLQLGDFSAAQRAMKKAYKLNAYNTPEKEQIGYIFKAVIFMGKLMKTLNSTPETDLSERMSLNEKLGDAAAQISNYKQALKYYENMLKCALELGHSGKALIPVYVSLAQTLIDDKQYAKGVEYFRKELQCHGGNDEQMARTWLNIADAQELGGESYTEVSSSYSKALVCAQAAGHHRLQLTVLKSLSVSQAGFKETAARQDTVERLRAVRAAHHLASDDDEEDLPGSEEASQDAVPEGDIDLDDYMSDSDASENEEYDNSKMPSGRVARRKTKSAIKRNEKGETPLHRACIDGDLKKVKALLAQGHPVNARDYCGWLPLHEAANHDYGQIVDALLEAGAWVNDRGGQGCGGVTPLHDACNCGNIRVIQLLVNKGANVHVKDDEGHTVLDSLLDYIHRSEGLLNHEDMASLRTTKRLLLNTMRGNNPHLSNTLNLRPNGTQDWGDWDDSADLPSIHRPSRRARDRRPLTSTQVTSNSCSPLHDVNSGEEDDSLEESVISAPHTSHKRSRTVLEKSDSEPDDCRSPPRPARRPPRADPPSTVCGVYRDVIASVRRSAVSRAGVPAVPRAATQPDVRNQAPLVDDDLYVGDDWLIDDMGGGKLAKRKRPDLEDIFTTTGIRRTTESAGGAGRRWRSDGSEERAKRKRRSGEAAEEAQVRLGAFESPDGGVAGRGHSAERTHSLSSSVHLMDVDSAMDEFSDSDPLLSAFDDDADDMFLGELDYHGSHIATQASGRVISQTAPSQHVATTSKCAVTSLGIAKSQPSGSRRLVKEPRQRTLAAFGLTSHLSQVTLKPRPTAAPVTLTQPAAALTRPVMKLKVKIKDHCILVPIPSADLTVQWLCGEVAQRYYKLYNMRPSLTIATKDGAQLSPDDPVSYMLSDNDEVEGLVLSWDLPPLPDRYTDACAVQKTVMYRNIRTSLSMAVTSQCVSLPNLALRPGQFAPLCKALQCQYVLKELHLQGNRLGDGGVSLLSAILPTLHSLTDLNLASNQVTEVGLRALVAVLEKGATSADKPLKMLERLNLGFNPLSDVSTQSVAGIVRDLPALLTLVMTSCDLTVRFFQQHRIALAEAFHGSGVCHVDLGLNMLGATGVELLLRCVHPRVLASLSLRGAIASYTAPHFHHHLATYLSQSDCVLSVLNLDSCHLLPSEHWTEVTSFVRRSRTLEHLSISSNPKITNADIAELLDAANQSEHSRLEGLVFNGCHVTGPLDTAFIDAINDKLGHARPLRHLAFTWSLMTSQDEETLRDVWVGRWADDAKCRFEGAQVVLSTADYPEVLFA